MHFLSKGFAPEEERRIFFAEQSQCSIRANLGAVRRPGCEFPGKRTQQRTEGGTVYCCTPQIDLGVQRQHSRNGCLIDAIEKYREIGRASCRERGEMWVVVV